MHEPSLAFGVRADAFPLMRVRYAQAMTAPGECTLRIVEPNVSGPSGHYAEFIRALAHRSEGIFHELRVHSRPAAREVLQGVPRVVVEDSPIRGRLGESRAMRACLQSGDPFLVLTARGAHAALLMLEAQRVGPGNLKNARLYFHWRETGSIQQLFMALGRGVRAQVSCIAPTQTTADFLRNAGWARVAYVPYPMLAPAEPPRPCEFRHLLVAGAARVNKGIEAIAEMAEAMARAHDATPLLVQTTPKRISGRRGDREHAAIERLRASGAKGLVLSDEAPQSNEYGERFAGAIVLAPYDPVHFADNVSGVVLDALLRGAPVIASAGSWPGRTVERFGAGATIAQVTPAALLEAVRHIRENWDLNCARAREAARVLAVEHDPSALARTLREGV